MTVSFKRWIALVALFAVTLAGTPINVMANDGLKESRYGISSPKSNEQAVVPKRPSLINIYKNPFRENTVSASLTGTSIIVQRSEPAPENLAVIVKPAGPSGKAINADATCSIQIPNLAKSPSEVTKENTAASIRQGVVAIYNFAAAQTIDTVNRGIQFATSQYEAATVQQNRNVRKSRSSDGKTIFSSYRVEKTTTLKAGVFKSIEKGSSEAVNSSTKIPFIELRNTDVAAPKNVAGPFNSVCPGSGNMSIFLFDAGDTDSSVDEVANDRNLPAGKFSVDMFDRSTRCMFGSVEDLVAIDSATLQKSVATKSVIDEDLGNEGSIADSLTYNAGEPFGFGQRLLIDQFVPRKLEQETTISTSGPRKSAVPAMLIGHRRTISKTTGLSVKSLIVAAKSIVKSIITAVEPLIGIERATDLHRDFQNQFYQLDNFIWSTGDLNYLWNNCEMPGRAFQ